MRRYIIDTNVLSETWKPNPDAAVLLWLDPNEYFIPAPVIAEIVDGLLNRPKALFYWCPRQDLNLYDVTH